MRTEGAAVVRAAGIGPRDAGGSGRRTRGRAFTLIELLVVISIIALLVAILVPGLSQAKELARRTTCAANLHGIGRGLSVYESANGSYPHVPLNTGGWGVVIGTSRDMDPADGVPNDRSPTSCLFLLVREGNCPEDMFVCPSTDEEASATNSKGWDFVDGTAVSYSLMCPYGPARQFDDGDRMRPIMADASPYFDPATGLRNEVDVADWTDAAGSAGGAGNSPNHAGKGQNVATPGGSTSWRRRPDVGVSRDNIYTRADGVDGTDGGGSIPPVGLQGLADDQGPAGPLDSYLVP